MIRWRFGNALHWYQVLVAIADQEVDIWVRNTTSTVMTSPDNTDTMWNMTSAMTTSPDNTNATGRSSGIESSEPLGRTAMPFCQSEILDTFPFPLPKDFLQKEENVPSTDIPSIYLQQRCPICFSGRANLQTSTCTPNLEVYTSIVTDIHISAQAIVCVDANFAQ